MAALGGAERTFIDTNVLVYAHDASEVAKQPVARKVLASLWASGSGALSTQVLQEFYNVATRRMPTPLSRAEAREIIDLYSVWQIVVIVPALIVNASRIEEEHGLSFWDALIVEAARAAGAHRLLSEDLPGGQAIAGVTILNPFRS